MSTIDQLRKYNIPGTHFVAFDWIATIIGAKLAANYFGYSFVNVLIILLIISVALHKVFNVDTVTNYYLGVSQLPERVKLEKEQQQKAYMEICKN